MTNNETRHICANGDAKQSAEKSHVSGLSIDLKIQSAPKSVTSHNKDELYEMIEVGIKQIQSGKVLDADIVMAQIKDEYGFSN